MNILAQANQLKELSDQQLPMVRGRVPEYLLVSELQRRDQMRKAHQADMAEMQQARGGTVSDELWQTVMPQTQQPQMGMMPQQGMQQQQQGPPPPMQQAMSAGGLVQRLAAGGMVRFKDGGSVKPATTLADLAAIVRPTISDGEALQRSRDMYGQDALTPIMAELASQQQQGVVGKPSIWQALMRNGAAMMASRNPTPLGGLGEGIAAALNGYSEDRDKYRNDQVRLQQQKVQNLAQRAGIAREMNSRQQGIAGLAGDFIGNSSRERNTDASLLNNNINAAAAQDAQERRTQMEIDAREPERAALADERRAQALDRSRKEEIYQGYLRKAKGDPALANQLMIRDQHVQMPRQISAEESLINGVIAQGRKAGMSDEEILRNIRTAKTRADITEERLNERATRIWKQLVENDFSAKLDPAKQQALWLKALEMAGNNSATATPQPKVDAKDPLGVRGAFKVK